jgi:hypothetical protein
MNIVLKSKDDSVAIMTIVDGADKEDCIRKFQQVHPEYTEWYENVEIPKSRENRDTWKMVNGKIVEAP